MNSIDFKYLYETNKLPERVLLLSSIELLNQVDSLNDFLKSLCDHVLSLSKADPTWYGYFFPFKKAILTYEFFVNYLECYQVLSNNLLDDPNKESFAYINTIKELCEEVLQKLSTNSSIVKVFKTLRIKERSEKRRKILQAWLDNFFMVSFTQKNKEKYNELKYKLNESNKLFEKNRLDSLELSSNAVFIPLAQKDKLEGLPNSLITLSSFNARNFDKAGKGWSFLIDDNTTYQVLKYAKNRSFRKKVYHLNRTLNSAKKIKNDNDAVLRKILSIKQQMAFLHKKNNYSELVLSKYSLATTEEAYNYLNVIGEQLNPYIVNIKNKLLSLAQKDGINILEDWDILYYYTKALHSFKRRADLTKNSNSIKKYFPFENTIKKLFAFFEKNLSLSIQEINRTSVNRELVITYKIVDLKTKRFGYFILSPNNNYIKNNPFQLSCLNYEKVGFDQNLPFVGFVSLNLNGTYKKEAYLNLDDLATLLHELGHAFYFYFNNPDDSKFISEIVAWDLIELPSQFLEFFIYDFKFVQNISSKNNGLLLEYDLYVKSIKEGQIEQIFFLNQDILKYKALLWLHEHFKQYSKKSPQQLVYSKLNKEGIVYNIVTDDYMINNEPANDYAPAGYIYLYSANIAFKLINNEGGWFNDYKDLRKVYTKLFNFENFNSNVEPLKIKLKKYIDINSVDIINFLKKNIDTKLFGENEC